MSTEQLRLYAYKSGSYVNTMKLGWHLGSNDLIHAAAEGASDCLPTMPRATAGGAAPSPGHPVLNCGTPSTPPRRGGEVAGLRRPGSKWVPPAIGSRHGL